MPLQIKDPSLDFVFLFFQPLFSYSKIKGLKIQKCFYQHLLFLLIFKKVGFTDVNSVVDIKMSWRGVLYFIFIYFLL